MFGLSVRALLCVCFSYLHSCADFIGVVEFCSFVWVDNPPEGKRARAQAALLSGRGQGGGRISPLVAVSSVSRR